MADLDTQNKRGSALGFNTPGYTVFPNPDGAIAAQADRQQSAYTYPGILATAQTAPAFFGDLTTLFCGYMIEIRNDNPTRNDTDTLIAQAQPSVRQNTSSPDDLNTAYAEFLS